MDYFFNTTSSTGTSAVRAAAYVRQEVSYVPLPDQQSATANVSWGSVSVGTAFVFQSSTSAPAIFPDPVATSAVSSSGLFFGANLGPVVASAVVLQSNVPEPPPSGGTSGLKFYWG
jgi:hypothetical protein